MLSTGFNLKYFYLEVTERKGFYLTMLLIADIALNETTVLARRVVPDRQFFWFF